MCNAILAFVLSLTCYAQEAQEAEAFQAVLLSGVGREGFTAIYQGAEDARLIYLDIGVRGQMVVAPHSCAGSTWGGLSDVIVHFHINLQVAGNSRVKIGQTVGDL